MTRRHPVDGRIYGYTYPQELDWLAAAARTHYCILEVGAFLGRVTEVLAENTRGHVYVVDPWVNTDDHDDEVQQEDMSACFDEYLENVGGLANVTTYRATSREAWGRMHHLKFDMVWIDGDHRYEYVLDDIKLWAALLRRDGLLCGHDGQYPDVQRAICEAVPNLRFYRTNESLIWYSHGK